MTPVEVLIAIQARSNSTRFPGKIYETIGGRRVLDHAIDQAKSVAEHLLKFSQKVKVRPEIAVLHPENDENLIHSFRSCGAILIGGDEHDVLSRYVKAQRLTGAQYVVRLTSDCPFIFPYIIAKHVNTAAHSLAFPHLKDGPLDYLSNVEEECRTAADGLDCEILSAKAIQWLDQNAVTPHDREHVTTALRRVRPPGLHQGIVLMNLDTSAMKISVDTPFDLEHMREVYHTREHKRSVARRLFGNSVYEL